MVEKVSGEPGFTHAGIQAEDNAELDDLFQRLQTAEAPYLPEGTTNCCYHKSDKSRTEDPDGLRWEAFYTHHETDERGAGPIDKKASTNANCCSGCC